MRRVWTGVLLALLVGGWIAACNQQPDYPPYAADTDGAVHLGGGSPGGSQGEASVSPCVAAEGVCMDQGDGNSCPQVSSLSCLTGSDVDASGTIGLVCCLGFDEAGASDAVVGD